MKIIVTGGAGFIGSAVIRHLVNHTDHQVLNLDKLTYAGNLESLASVENSERYTFRQIDICDAEAVHSSFHEFCPDGIMHLAAESHVDRSIESPYKFIQTNIVGTYTLLDTALKYYRGLSSEKQKLFRFHHVSTDEVYGDLLNEMAYFTEESPYAPSSPYSASKASSDHLVRSWYRTFGLPVLISNSSNNYGPYQFPEKLIPLMILNALEGKPLPIYGEGKQIRDWIYVEDHAQALITVFMEGAVGETYNIGCTNEKQNIEVVRILCRLLDEKIPNKPKNILNFDELIVHVQNRPGHDFRYAIDASKIKKELNWEPVETFETGIMKTINWYLANPEWCRTCVQKGDS